MLHRESNKNPVKSENGTLEGNPVKTENGLSASSNHHGTSTYLYRVIRVHQARGQLPKRQLWIKTC